MARHGVWQLSKLTVTYCEFSGSSRGTRDFLQNMLQLFREQNPQLAIEERTHPGHHPWLNAEYRSGNMRSVGVKNQPAGEVLRFAVFLRSAAGRRTSERVNPRQVLPVVKRDGLVRVRASPSVQGQWRPGLFAAAEK
ncbi:hypothetical protein WJX81_005350 [Elliptochloris bilobata]|uniref:Large ribosomal subunit protein mL43 n=1 Tax=Elliptochloris bilobata TaxID=381761 RepID=A0AAW1RW35_9CHLO